MRGSPAISLQRQNQYTVLLEVISNYVINLSGRCIERTLQESLALATTLIAMTLCISGDIQNTRFVSPLIPNVAAIGHSGLLHSEDVMEMIGIAIPWKFSALEATDI
ncbi:hypothetical protein QVD17_30196 [Tagetes erecta]|uniref:Uncharacterized protein n=1 Tax=Tagetes erecta TaxID=13708 RepID=A0AAD8NMT5_TARER|nr:hypothetical protein QVD17_30196 [Tagetes erecta]